MRGKSLTGFVLQISCEKCLVQAGLCSIEEGRLRSGGHSVEITERKPQKAINRVLGSEAVGNGCRDFNSLGGDTQTPHIDNVGVDGARGRRSISILNRPRCAVELLGGAALAGVVSRLAVDLKSVSFTPRLTVSRCSGNMYEPDLKASGC